MPAAPISQSPERGQSLWRRWWPWLVLALPWWMLINHLRLEWTVNAQYGYGFFVPLLAAYLAWLRWPRRPEPAPLAHPALLLVVVVPLLGWFLPMSLLAESSPDWRFLSWNLAGSTVAISACAILYRAGWPWLRHFAFPLLFILVAVPWPMPLENRLVNALTAENATAAAHVANWCGVPAVAHQNIVQMAAGTVGVDDACSGVRSLQTTLMSALFFGEWLLLSWVRRAALLAAGLLLAVLTNFLRILTLVGLLASFGHPAMEAGHDMAGWAVVAVTFIGLWLLAKLLEQEERPSGENSLQTLLRPWPQVMLASGGIWIVLVLIGTQAWFAWHEAKLPPPLRWTVQWPRAGRDYKALLVPETTRTILKYQHGSSVQWLADDATLRWNGFFFVWDAGRTASTLARSHRPDICLPATGRELDRDFGIEFYQTAGLALPIRVYQFSDRGRPLFVFYCNWEDRHPSAINVAPEQREVNRLKPERRWEAVREGQRNNGQQVLEVVLWGPETVQQARAAFQSQICPLIQRLPAS